MFATFAQVIDLPEPLLPPTRIRSRGFIDQPLFQNMIVESYCCNAIIAILIFWILVSLKEKYKNHIGFIFLFGSGTKFLMFFVIFYGPFKQDGEIIIYEFISFFLPYTICLIFETYQLSKQLNKM